MIENAYENLKSRALVDWGVILLGVQGVFGTVGRLSENLIEDFATHQIEVLQPTDPTFDAIATLALDSNVASDEVQRLVESICEAKGVDIALSMRKWRVALIEDACSRVDSDPLYGQIQLSEIWSQWDWPSDAPSPMRKEEGVPLSQEFGSPEAFFQARKEVEKWVESEFAFLQKASEVRGID